MVGHLTQRDLIAAVPSMKVAALPHVAGRKRRKEPAT